MGGARPRKQKPPLTGLVGSTQERSPEPRRAGGAQGQSSSITLLPHGAPGGFKRRGRPPGVSPRLLHFCRTVRPAGSSAEACKPVLPALRDREVPSQPVDKPPGLVKQSRRSLARRQIFLDIRNYYGMGPPLKRKTIHPGIRHHAVLSVLCVSATSAFSNAFWLRLRRAGTLPQKCHGQETRGVMSRKWASLKE